MRDEDKPCWNCKNLDNLGGCNLNDGINPVWLEECETNNFKCYEEGRTQTDNNNLFEFRDFNTSGELETFLADVEEPAFLVSLDGEYRIMYGEFDELVPKMSDYSVLNRVAVISLPKNQEEIDKLFQSSGLTSRFIREWKAMQNIK